MTNDPLVLAFDIGTSSSRTALFDSCGTRLVPTTAQAEYRLIRNSDGGAELLPRTLMRAALDCLDRTFARYHRDQSLRGREIVAVGTSCFWHSLVGTDGRGRALTPIYTWADSRCRNDAAQLRAKLSERAIHAKTGCMVRASFWPAKLRWLRRTQPRLFGRVSLWMSPAEWLYWQFCGRANCAYAMASGTGLFNPTTLDWDDELLRVCAVQRGALNPLGEEEVATSETFAQRYPALRATQWFAAIGDGAASNLGSGSTQPKVAAINYGTSGAVRVIRHGRRARAPFGLFCYRVDADRFLVGGAVSNAGNLYAWARRELNLTADARKLESSLAARPFPMEELTVLPFWVSERAPTWQEDIKGMIIGLTQATMAVDLLQAIQEASFYRLARIAELMSQTTGQRLRFTVSGGLPSSRSGMQRLANVLGSELIVCSEREASLRGAAIFALEKLGLKVSVPAKGRVIRPQPAVARKYLEARRRHLKLEKCLTGALYG